MSDVVEAEATSTTEAETTSKSASGLPAVAAKPQEGEAAKVSKQKPEAKKVEAKAGKTAGKSATETDAEPDAAKAAEARPESEEQTKAGQPPAEYVFKTPEGEPINGPVIDAFTATAREHGWTQEIADQELGRLSGSMRDARTALTAEWSKELRADKDFGGSKFDENVGALKSAVERVGGVAAYEALVKDGLDQHPPTVRLLHKFVKAISPDKFTAGVSVPGRPGDIANPNDTSVEAFSKRYA